MNIVVNGKPVSLDEAALSYEDACVLAGEQPGASMTYCLRNDSVDARGTLAAGDRIIVGEGMVFNVCMTGGA